MTDLPDPLDPPELWQPPPLDISEFLDACDRDTAAFLLTLERDAAQMWPDLAAFLATLPEPDLSFLDSFESDLTELLAELADPSSVFS